MIQAYSDATVAGDKRRQGTAIATGASIANLLSQINPHLPKDTVRSLFATNIGHHVVPINKFQDKDYQGEDETWTAMEHHVYVIADTLTNAIAKQFPAKFGS